MVSFDTKYVHCVWDENLKGKKVFYSDTILELRHEIETDGYADADQRGICERYNANYLDSPFIVRSRNDKTTTWSYVYYDPYYEFKKALEEGKQLQIKLCSGMWEDLRIVPSWSNPPEDYRIKPEKEPAKRMTYRQLAEWLAKGNGQYLSNNEFVYDCINGYTIKFDNKELPEDYKIRKWGSDEWIEPTVDIYNEVFATKECE